MPRRAPKRPPPALDLSTHLVSFDSLPSPCDPAVLFPTAAPVELEVGSGKGLFLATTSAARPDRNFLGVEIAAGYARLCAGRLAAAGATNARIVHGDATRLVRDLVPAGCLAAVHVYFPDPWWKARHRKRRVLSETFLRAVARVLEPGAELHVWTDVEEYFRETLDLAAASGLYADPVEESAAEPRHDLDYRTHFERRTRLAGAPVWRARLTARGPRA
jgi:tRNA (guanine-N7-)-methyltransferase